MATWEQVRRYALALPQTAERAPSGDILGVVRAYFAAHDPGAGGRHRKR